MDVSGPKVSMSVMLAYMILLGPVGLQNLAEGATPVSTALRGAGSNYFSNKMSIATGSDTALPDQGLSSFNWLI
jgi:hypothetical protein